MTHLTKQQIFDKAYIGLAKQNFERAVDGKGQCLYYDRETGRRCAVGHCIPYDGYHEGLEGTSGDDVMRMFDLIDYGDGMFVIHLQHAHDGVNEAGVRPVNYLSVFDGVESVQERLKAFAEYYNLQVPALEA